MFGFSAQAVPATAGNEAKNKMNGSRSFPQRHGERSSLDALNRTIEGLEARIEGLMAGGSRDEARRPPLAGRTALPADPVAEIRDRQRALEASRAKVAERLERRPPEDTRPYSAPLREHMPAAAFRAAPAAAPDLAMTDIARALVGLRQELKQDISDGLAREMNSLRAEMRGIRTEAESQTLADDMRADMQRLAESINQLGRQASPAETQALRGEFEELRTMIDGLAREDSIQRMERQWGAVGDRLSGFDGQGVHDELSAVAMRLDDIKTQLGGMRGGPVADALEDKILTIAHAVEILGKQVGPDNHRMVSQFSALDERLDEISRAIVASGHAATPDHALFKSLENRIAAIADQIQTIGRPAETGLGARIEALAARVEELANEEAAARLDERLQQLSLLLERSQEAQPQPELTGHLADISRKIDALDHGSVNDVLAERLDTLSRRIEELDLQQEPRVEDDRFSRIEGRLVDIAQRLEEAQTAPPEDHEALRGLEAQIAHLSSLISVPASGIATEHAALSPDIENRMAVLEDYMATSDEYIIEAARQAAEAVMEAYGRNAPAGAAHGNDMAAISALADDLRTLEELSRSSDERTARTFEALHETLVQIAGKLERMDAPSSRRPAYDDHDDYDDRPVMPKAAMPQFADAPASFADVDLLADDELEPPQPFGRKVPESQGVSQEERQGEWPKHADAEAASPAYALADDDQVRTEMQPATLEGGSGKKSLLSGLAKRLSRKRAEEPVETPMRQLVDPSPSIDAIDSIAPEEANQLLEPGSGVPDVKKILERVRAGQAGKDSAAGMPASEAEKADFIAAARRAAQMAAEETDTLGKSPRQKRASGAPASSGIRRPILMAVGAVLLAIMSYPLVSALLSGDEAPVPPPVAAIEETAAENTQTGDAGAAGSDDAAAVETAREALGETGSQAALPEDMATLETDEAPADVLEPLPADETGKAAGNAPLAEETLKAEAEPAPAGGADIDPAPTASINVSDDIGPASLVKAAREKDPLALFEIGARYTEGRGVKADPAEAVKWYQLSADEGFAPAEYRLANVYEKGTGVERDLEKAKAFYRLAAEKGNASAMHNLAVLLATGAGATPDYKAASTWFQKAADLGVRDSQFNLAILYARGNGVNQDLEESYKWFAVAARDGDKDAAEKRDEVANALRPEQLDSAKAKFNLWRPKALDTKANSAIVPDEWAGKAHTTASIDMDKAVRNIQAILNNNGFDAGKPDGQMGKKTIAAIKAFQTSVGQKPTGEIDDALVKELLTRNKG